MGILGDGNTKTFEQQEKGILKGGNTNGLFKCDKDCP